MDESERDGPRGAIERTSSRGVFSELVASALRDLETRASPLAVTYLIELLESHVLAPAPGHDDDTLAEALLTARQAGGSARVVGLRQLGDRALFVSGFFADSLSRRAVGIDYYRAIGRTAYDDLSSYLDATMTDPGWVDLYRELAERFETFADLLAEIGDRSRTDRAGDSLRIFDDYVRTGCPVGRRRLVRRGLSPPGARDLRRWQ